MYGNPLHLSALYNFTQQLSAGVGVGADRYEKIIYQIIGCDSGGNYVFRRFNGKSRDRRG